MTIHQTNFFLRSAIERKFEIMGARISLIEARAIRLVDSAALYQAMGGGLRGGESKE